MSDNPMAFPTPPASFSPMGDMALAEEGMTLRDWFATHAMGMGFDWTRLHETGGYAEAAAVAYEIADAMLAARKDAPHA